MPDVPSSKTNEVWYKKPWGLVLLIALFPFTLTYLIWKQKWQTPVKLGAIALMWLVVIVAGSSQKTSSQPLSTTQPSPTSQQQTTLATATPTSAPSSSPSSKDQALQKAMDLCASGNQMGCDLEDQILRGPQAGVALNVSDTHDTISLYLTNKEQKPWSGCYAFILDNGNDYQSDTFDVQPGKTVRVGWGNFVQSDGTRFLYQKANPFTTGIELDCSVSDDSGKQIVRKVTIHE